MYKLVGTDGTRLYAFDLTAGMHKLGRSPETEFSVPDKTVSRNHAQIEVAPEGEPIHLTDVGSHNGTTINGRRIESREEVKVGDVIQFGQVEFKIKTESEAGAKTSTRTSAIFSEHDVEKSVVLSVNEALRALPSKVTQRPELFPTLSEMARVTHLAEPREVMLERSLELVNKVIPAERLAVLLSGGEADDLQAAATILPSGKDPGSFTLSRTIAQEIMNNRQAILIGDPTVDPRFSEQQSIIMSQMHAAMAVPLYDEDSVLGVLYVDTTNPLHRYNDEYLSLLVTFGNIIASRLLNYTLLSEREERQVYEAELRRASGIQQNLLPGELPTVPGYEVAALQQQCRAVGGDLYDIVALPDGRLVIIVADVSGKGMGAALLMANILASFRILYNVTEFTLKEVVAMVSKQLFVSSGPADFATLFVGVIDPKDHSMNYINAGHNPPVVARSDGTHEHLEPCGCMIGAFDMDMWTIEKITLGPGDMFLVFTDGVTEAEGTEEQYQEKRLEELLLKSSDQAPTDLLQTIMNDILNFIGDVPRSDDITMLTVKRTN